MPEEQPVSFSVDQLLEIGVRARLSDMAKQLIRATGCKVQGGPFTGMLLPDAASWGDAGDIVPKLLGTYESELHPAIEKAIAREPDLVFNIGCAEGYYGIGLALRVPEARVVCIDTDEKAREICGAAAVLNGVASRVEVAQTVVWWRKFEGVWATKPLVVIDCEGAELEILSEHACEFLQKADMIIECHDFIDRSITGTLLKRLGPFHNIEIIQEGPRDHARQPLLRNLGSFERALAVCEFRPVPMHWLVCMANRD